MIARFHGDHERLGLRLLQRFSRAANALGANK